MKETGGKYWDYLLPQMPRLLAQLDRRPFSETYGCFDRKYWHQRFTDFPAASLQQGVESLAFLYSSSPETCEYHEAPVLLEWIQAAVRFTANIQKGDGSFDEWYLNERGWAGPTSYVLNSLFEAHRLTGEFWNTQTVGCLKEIFRRASRFLIDHEERDVLSNHQALALLTIYQAFVLLDDSNLLAGYEKVKARFLEGFCEEEGWSIEYDGADPGYQTATLSFLARLHALNSDPEIQRWVTPMIDFVSHFYFPDGSFARGLGSRSTSNIFLFGFAYWGQFIPLSHNLSIDLFSAILKRRALGADHQEDHYFIYRLPEFFMCLKVKSSNERNPAKYPYEVEGCFRHFPKSGHVFRRSHGCLLLVDSRFGGRFVAFDTAKGRLIHAAGDIFIKHGSGIFSSGGGPGKLEISRTGDAWRVSGAFSGIRIDAFSPVKFLIFKTAFLPLRSACLSKWIKMLIRRRLMFSSKGKNQTYVRTFEWKGGVLHISSEAFGPGKVYQTYGLSSRYVPQSGYVLAGELEHQNISTERRIDLEIPCAE